MTQMEQATKSIFLMMVLTMGSKFLGFFREVLIAYKFGAGIEIDSFLMASSATFLFTYAISVGLNTTMIPVLSEIEAKEGYKGKVQHTNNILNITLALSLILFVLGWLLAPQIISILAPGFTWQQYNLTVFLMRCTLPTVLLSGAISIFRAYLQSEMMFTETALAQYPVNFVFIAYLLFFAGDFGIVGLAIASVLGIVGQFLVQLPSISKSGFTYEFSFDLKEKYVNRILILTGPVLLGAAITELNIAVDRMIASSLEAGSISALNYADRLVAMVLSVFVGAITTVVFPLLSKHSNSGNMDDMEKTLKYGINLVLLITIPSTVGLISLASPIVGVVYQRGEFGSLATVATVQALIYYSLGLAPSAIRLLLNRVFYSLQNTKVPMVTGAVTVVLNIIFNLILVRYMGHGGLALGTSLATTFGTLLMFYSLRLRLGNVGVVSYMGIFTKTLLSSLVMGFIANSANHFFVSVVNTPLALVISIILSALIYLTMCYLLNIREIRALIGNVIKKLLEGDDSD